MIISETFIKIQQLKLIKSSNFLQGFCWKHLFNQVESIHSCN